MQDLVEGEILAMPDGPATVVELGAGNGSFAIRLVSAKVSLQVIGLEATTDLIRVATRAAIEGGLAESVRFERSDLLSLPLSDESSDYIVGLLVLTQASSPHVLLSEVFRALLPGGVVVFMEDIPEEGEARIRADGLPFGRGGFDESRLRALVLRSPFKTSVQYQRHEFEGGTFLEVKLTRPIPEQSPTGSWRFGGGSRGR
jgi:SAM-dependent methyltransferase